MLQAQTPELSGQINGASTNMPASNLKRFVVPAIALSASALTAHAGDTAGWDKGKFFIADEGGANKLNIGGAMQFRWYGNLRDDTADGNDFTHGFRFARVDVDFGGTVYSKDIGYRFRMRSVSNGASTIQDAFFTYNLGDGFTLKGGQYKPGLIREESVTDVTQLALERSVTNAVFNQGRVQGLNITYVGKQFRASADFSDGIRTLNTDFNSPTEADFALTGRVDFLAAGDDFKRFEDFTSWRSQPLAIMIGGAAHYQDGGETGGTTDRSLIIATLDASFEGDGWNAFVAGIYRNTDTAGGSDADDFGLVLQGGIFVTDQTEVFARYDAIFADDSTGDDFQTITAGVNYYVTPQSHAVKLTADVCYYLDDTADATYLGSQTNAGLLSTAEDGEFVLRLQAQLMF